MALAWVELHVARDDVKVSVRRDGKADVEHRVTLLVSGGPLRSMTIRGVDADAVIAEGGYVVSKKEADKGSVLGALPIRAERAEAAERPGLKPVPAGTQGPAELTVTFEGKGLSRGAYLLSVRYTTDLGASGGLVPDGASTLVRWTGPAWDDGLETTRLTFVLPPAPTEPRVVETDEDSDAESPVDEASASTFLSTLTRRPDGDVLDLARPYSPRGERVTWSVRVDRRVFDDGPASSAPAQTAASTPSSPSQSIPFGATREAMGLLIGLGLLLVVSLCVAAQSLEVTRRARDRELVARPLLPLPLLMRAPLAGALLAGGVYLQLQLPSTLLGALVVCASALAAWQRAPRAPARPKLRPPGQWLPISVQEALFSPIAPDKAIFDPVTRTGKVALAIFVAFVAAAVAAAARISVHYGVLVGLDAAPFFVLFFTGRRRAFPPDLAVDTVRTLRQIVSRVDRRLGGRTRIVPRVRMPSAEPDADELRVVFLPSRPLRGLRAVELGIAHVSGPGGEVLLPEILVRCEEGTPCDEVARTLGAFGSSSRGRRPDERVIIVSPKVPTIKVTAELCAAVLERLTDTAVGPTEATAPDKGRKRVAKATPLDRDEAA
jgi:hypothetical protein